LIGFGRFIVRCQGCILYTYTGVGFSAVARFDKLGDAIASTRGTSDRTGSTLLYIYKNEQTKPCGC
uniref:hypothetical protein n=1 Tax=Alloprevotella sp. TaxID=1872471 RepID=UPI003FD7EDDF